MLNVTPLVLVEARGVIPAKLIPVTPDESVHWFGRGSVVEFVQTLGEVFEVLGVVNSNYTRLDTTFVTEVRPVTNYYVGDVEIKWDIRSPHNQIGIWHRSTCRSILVGVDGAGKIRAVDPC